MTVQAAFYTKPVKLPGGLVDKAIRFRTASDVSHVELLLPDGFCYSSSGRDGGVRRKIINTSEGWELIPVEFADPERIQAFFGETKGLPYDFSGVLIGQLLTAHIHGSGKWFCSEWCAEALGLRESWRYSPALLKAFLLSINEQITF